MRSDASDTTFISSIWLKNPEPDEGLPVCIRTGSNVAFRRIDMSLPRALSEHVE